MVNISDIRKHYNQGQLYIHELDENPIHQFQTWLKLALDSKCNEPTAMVLSTVSRENKPSSRVVLLKEIAQGGFTFFSNYQSAKGKEMDSNPFVALNFFWSELERQVRVEGRVEKIGEDESDAYFQSRPRESRIGAWASRQSAIVVEGMELQQNYKLLEEKYKGKIIPRPSHWGGYRVVPDKIEFWQGRANRMHDRFCYVKMDDLWTIQQLAP